ncbi:ATP-dependent DNA helicase PIF1-like protein [Tanacetum coccineum]
MQKIKGCGTSMLPLADILASNLLSLTQRHTQSIMIAHKGNIAHNFSRLKEGAIYSVKNFIVVPNKDEFCVMRFADLMLEFDGETTVQKSFVKSNDAARYVTNVGRTTQTRTGSKTLDFYLANCRGQQIRVTLWGGLGDMLIQKRTRHVGLYPPVITAVSVKLYNNRLYLSSTSSTLIVNDEKIPVLKRLKTNDTGVELTKEILPANNTAPKAGTLENLLMYMLELEISDDTVEVVVIMFDEMTTSLLGCSASSILDSEEQDEEDHSGLPTALANIVGTSHTLELKSHTYYEHGSYERFTCWKVVTGEDGEGGASSGMTAANEASKASVLKRMSKTPSVVTPSKPGGLEDSDTEESLVADSQPKGGDVACSFDMRKSRRVVLDDSE